MDFNLTDEQQILRDSARRFFREHYGLEQRRAQLATGPGFSAGHWSRYAEFGWLALGLPEDVGGLGCSCVDTAILMEEFGRGLALEPYVSTAVACAHVLDRCADAHARRAMLGAVAAGEMRLALAHEEPDRRYELERVETIAMPAGGGYLLNGRKSGALDAPAADRLIASARIEGEEGFALFLVGAAAEGLQIEAYPLIDGTRAADIVLRNVPADLSCLLARGAAARALLEEALDRATLARVAMALGAMEAVLETTAEYLKTRVQFGQAIGKFQALQHRLAEMFVEVQEARSILCCGLAHVEADAPLRRAMISAARIVAVNAARIVGGQGIQLHGSIGVTAEYVVGHYYKHLLAFEKIHGDAHWHLERFARHVAT